MEVTLQVPGLFEYLLTGWAPPDDPIERIGLGMVAYLSDNDPAHAFLAAARLHDAAYSAESPAQTETDAHGNFTWPRYRVDKRFLDQMLDIAADDLELTKTAITLYFLAREFGGKVWENEETR